MDDIEEDIKITQQFITALTADPIEQAKQRDILGVQLRIKFSRSKVKADLENAIESAQQAIGSVPSSYPDRAIFLDNLGVCFAIRFESYGDIADLEEAIYTAKQARDTVPSDYPHRPLFLNHLGNHLRSRSVQTNNAADLEEAIQITQDAVNATADVHQDRALEGIPLAHPSRAMRLNNLGFFLGEKFNNTGVIADLENAIKTAEEAVLCAPSGHPNMPEFLNNFALRLAERWKTTGAASDLQKAIEIAEMVVEGIPSGHYRGASLNNLGILLGDRFERTGATKDLDKAIEMAKQAVNATPPSSTDKARHLNNLALRLGNKFETTLDLDDLEKAIETAQLAVDESSPGHPERVGRLNNLESFLRYKFAWNKDMSHLDKAITTAQHAVDAIPSDHPQRALCLNNLGHGFAARFVATGHEADLKMSYTKFVSAFEQRTSSVHERVKAAKNLLSSPFVLQDSLHQLQYASQSMELIPQLTPHSLRNTDKQYLLLEAAGLASDAAAIALISGKSPALAVSWLEAGRGVLASALQDLRTDLSNLQKQHPQLSASFEALRAVLDDPIPSNFLFPKTDSTFNTETEAGKRIQAQQQLDQLIQDIRQQPGFDGFLLPLTAEEIQGACADGPVIIINVSHHRCDALAILQTHIECIELPHATYKEIQEYRRSVSASLNTTLEWLWDRVVHPILEHLGYLHTPSDKDWPRVWWIPTGPLVGFPLHAAGYHLEGQGKTALDRVVSSYATSLRSMIHSRQKQPVTQQGGNMVLVSMETTAGESPLRHTRAEITAVRELGVLLHVDPITPEKTKSAVRSALEACEIFHFAGHGITNARQPLQSLLLLDDWRDDPLTVGSLLDTNLQDRRPFLAYLSACGTGESPDDRSVDESLHLTSAFQLAGFQHVIGTLWDVNDALCVDMARLLYEILGERGLKDQAVGYGLHSATRQLRDKWIENMKESSGVIEMGRKTDEQATGPVSRRIKPKQTGPYKLLWIPYVHYGV
ncbi:hypothetical protein PG989_002122 [Apiospora arundinis]